VEAACLAHDIGHPPFGHTGEDVLKEKMKVIGGFEGNAQNLRIITQLETRSAKQGGPGLNITRATLDAMLKYKTPYSKIDKSGPLDKWKFCYDSNEELVRWASLDAPSGAKSFECQIMDWADDIAYSTHDLEDGIKSGMITVEKIDSRIENNVRAKIGADWDQGIWDDVISKIKEASTGTSAYEKKGKRRDLIASFIHEFITATKAKKRQGGPYPSRYQFELEKDHKQRITCDTLKHLVWELIIDDERVATLARRARIIVTTLFDEFTKFEDGSRTREMYPLDFRERLDKAEENETKTRIACDFIAGMTDSYATRLYSRLNGGESRSLMEIL
jgi:dGTPase